MNKYGIFFPVSFFLASVFIVSRGQKKSFLKSHICSNYLLTWHPTYLWHHHNTPEESDPRQAETRRNPLCLLLQSTALRTRASFCLNNLTCLRWIVTIRPLRFSDHWVNLSVCDLSARISTTPATIRYFHLKRTSWTLPLPKWKYAEYLA